MNMIYVKHEKNPTYLKIGVILSKIKNIYIEQNVFENVMLEKTSIFPSLNILHVYGDLFVSRNMAL